MLTPNLEVSFTFFIICCDYNFLSKLSTLFVGIQKSKLLFNKLYESAGYLIYLLLAFWLYGFCVAASENRYSMIFVLFISYFVNLCWLW